MSKFKAKSIIVSRKPNKNREGLWSVLIALFDENNPHLKGREPKNVLEYKEIEEVQVKELGKVSFYPTGNDVVINDVLEVDVGKRKNTVTLKGKQS